MSSRASRGWWLVVLTAIWVLLQGEVNLANVLGGVAAAAVVVVAVPMAGSSARHRVHPLALARFVGFVLTSLVTSSARVVVATVSPTPARLRSGFVICELPGATPLVTAMVSNAITLTPGTLTVKADVSSDPATIEVHVLGLGAVDDFRAEVADLHRRVTSAVTPVPVEPVEVVS